MLRLVELGLFLVPFVGFLVWRLVSAGGGPPPALVAVAAVLLVLLAVMLVWFGTDDALHPGEHYVPAQLRHGGEILPGHAAPR